MSVYTEMGAYSGEYSIQVASLASATAGMASLASHRMATPCACMLEEVHDVENQDSIQKCVNVCMQL